ncbi:MAG: hypothetical protein R3B70_46535 [Polyangiaceae bacterium]
MIKPGAGIFWLLVIYLFGAAIYFAVHVRRMMELSSGQGSSPGAAPVESAGEGESREGAASP